MNERIIEFLRVCYPHLHHIMIDIKSIGLDEYRIKLQDGRRVIYNDRYDEMYWIDQSIDEYAAYDKELVRRVKRMITFYYLSLKDAAEQLDIPYATFTRYVSGKRKMPMWVIVDLAKDCNVSLDVFLDLDYLFD